MQTRRLLALWFPHLGAERCLRTERSAAMGPLALVGAERGAQILTSLSPEASALGLFRGQPLRDALALCPTLQTRPDAPQADAALLRALRRWAGKFSPWVAEAAPDGLTLDLTGCAHLFGGEVALLAQVESDCAAFRLTLQAGLADSLGAAWALARYGGQGPGLAGRSGDAIDQEARATRARASRRRTGVGAGAGLGTATGAGSGAGVGTATGAGARADEGSGQPTAGAPVGGVGGVGGMGGANAKGAAAPGQVRPAPGAIKTPAKSRGNAPANAPVNAAPPSPTPVPRPALGCAGALPAAASASMPPPGPIPPPAPALQASRIAPPGQIRQALADLPLAALRLAPETCDALGRLGLRRIGDVMDLPRATLLRRFGRPVGLRLEQALGLTPEPISPASADPHFATRLTLPDPIGLRSDLEAGIDRLLPPLCTKLAAAGQGARRLRLQAFRTDHSQAEIEIGLARPSADPDRIRPLLLLKLDALEAGDGIDGLRLEAHGTEPIHARQMKGQLEISRDATRRQAQPANAAQALSDLIGRLGARIGPETVLRLHPADSHIPENTAQILAAAWSDPAPHWPPAPTLRPLRLWPPEPVQAGPRAAPPPEFRWRRRSWTLAHARGPERLAPEWWLDAPAWRSGVRDYWELLSQDGHRLWLYFAHGGPDQAGGWFCHGRF